MAKKVKHTSKTSSVLIGADNTDYLRFRERYNDPSNHEFSRDLITDALMTRFGRKNSRRYFGFLLKVLYDNEIRVGKSHQQAIIPVRRLVQANLKFFFDTIWYKGALPGREAKKAFVHVATETFSDRLESLINRGQLARITEELYQIYLLNKKSSFLDRWKSAEVKKAKGSKS
jgi:hypothetical protein